MQSALINTHVLTARTVYASVQASEENMTFTEDL